MKEFFLILFFSKTTLLTPQPISFIGDIEITPINFINAITPGASIQIDITSMTHKSQPKEYDIKKRRGFVRNTFPQGSIYAYLYTTGGKTIRLGNRGFSLSKKRTWLTLSSENGVPIHTKYKKVVISSNFAMKNTLIYWRNYKY